MKDEVSGSKARICSTTPLGFTGFCKIFPVLALAGSKFNFEQREAGSRDQSAFFRRRHTLPRILRARSGGAARIVGQCLMIVMKKLCESFSGYFLYRHTFGPFQQPDFAGFIPLDSKRRKTCIN